MPFDSSTRKSAEGRRLKIVGVRLQESAAQPLRRRWIEDVENQRVLVDVGATAIAWNAVKHFVTVHWPFGRLSGKVHDLDGLAIQLWQTEDITGVEECVQLDDQVGKFKLLTATGREVEVVEIPLADDASGSPE